MDYFDYNNANFLPTSSFAREEADGYPFLGQTSATEWSNNYTFTNGWSMGDQPGPMANSSTSLRATTGHDSLPSFIQNDDYSQPPYSEDYWPAIGQQAQSHHSNYLSWDAPFVGTVAPEVSTAVPTPSSIPLDYWGASQSGPSTSTFYTENVPIYHQPSAGPSRTGPMSTGRFNPYGMSRSHIRLNEYRNAEAGPSTLIPPPVLYVDQPTLQPSGGLSETMADAETTQTIPEEDRIPTPKKTRRTNGQGRPRHHRVQMRRDTGRLCDWVRRRIGIRGKPSFNAALEFVVRLIPRVRPLVYQEPHLLMGGGKRTMVGLKTADDEFERRNVERELFQRLSQRYLLEQNRSGWSRRALLSLVLEDLENPENQSALQEAIQ